jgi:hypothetical protein
MATPLELWSDEEFQEDAKLPAISNVLTDDSRIVLHAGDSYEFLRTLPGGFSCTGEILSSLSRSATKR